MTDILVVLALAVLPALGNLAGTLLAEMVLPPRWVVGAALHGAAGIAIALITFDLMPLIIDTVPLWNIVAAFALGAAVSVGLAYAIRSIGQRSESGEFHAWMIYMAIGADLFSDGMMTGAGTAVNINLGLLIALAQLVANIPGGFASTANLRRRKVTRRIRVIASAFMFSAVIASTMLGFLLLRDNTQEVQNTVIAAIVGLLLLATVEDIIPEGDAPRPSRWLSSLAFTTGFVGLAVASSLMPNG
jgi:ZIP family zinc transporter